MQEVSLPSGKPFTVIVHGEEDTPITFEGEGDIRIERFDQHFDLNTLEIKKVEVECIPYSPLRMEE